MRWRVRFCWAALAAFALGWAAGWPELRAGTRHTPSAAPPPVEVPFINLLSGYRLAETPCKTKYSMWAADGDTFEFTYRKAPR